MTYWVLNQLGGFVEVEIIGDRLEELINLCIKEGVQLTNIRRTGARMLYFSLPLSHFKSIRSILRRTNCRLRIRRKHGFPFLFRRLRKRSLFVVGMFMFLLLIYASSAIIWKVEIKGNERIPQSIIIEAADKAGLKPGALKYKLKNTGTIQKNMLNNVDGALLLLLEIDGTKAIITVVEKVRPEKPIVKGQQNIVSLAEATIVSVLAEQGLSQVKKGQFVRKGDILISGQIGGEAGGEEHISFVEAKGVVKGLVWMDADIVIPLNVQKNVMTGEFKRRYLLEVGSTRIGLKQKTKPYEHYEIMTTEVPMKIGKWTLPLAWVTLKSMETTTETVERSTEEATIIGLKSARSEIRNQIGEEAEITGEKVLHQTVDNGKVYMKIQFDVIRDIGKDQPIVQGEDAFDN
ncbi:MAG: sporulation protein YqfD [Bacilli bacterium]